jgi:uncharacterized membrane protein
MQFKKNYLKYIVAWVGCFAIRLIPFRAPNVEPIMSAAMPFAKQYGKLSGFMFGFLSIVIYDAVTAGIGIWTAITAVSYGLVGVGAAWYLKSRAATRGNFVKYSVVATVAYDIATGLTLGPLFFHQKFMNAVLGQIPFTALHLAGNIAFAFFLSPVIYRWVVMNPSLESAVIPENATPALDV